MCTCGWRTPALRAQPRVAHRRPLGRKRLSIHVAVIYWQCIEIANKEASRMCRVPSIAGDCLPPCAALERPIQAHLMSWFIGTPFARQWNWPPDAPCLYSHKQANSQTTYLTTYKFTWLAQTNQSGDHNRWYICLRDPGQLCRRRQTTFRFIYIQIFLLPKCDALSMVN